MRDWNFNFRVREPVPMGERQEVAKVVMMQHGNITSSAISDLTFLTDGLVLLAQAGKS